MLCSLKSCSHYCGQALFCCPPESTLLQQRRWPPLPPPFPKHSKTGQAYLKAPVSHLSHTNPVLLEWHRALCIRWQDILYNNKSFLSSLWGESVSLFTPQCSIRPLSSLHWCEQVVRIGPRCKKWMMQNPLYCKGKFLPIRFVKS